MINVVEGKMLVSRLDSEDKTVSGIILGTQEKQGADIHIVKGTGVDYLVDGDEVVCESPSKVWEADGYGCEVGITDATNALLKRHGNEWKPLRNDILVKLKKQEHGGGIILQSEDIDASVLQTFTVIDAGGECVDVAVGDVVVLPWLRVTPPFTIKGYEEFGVTCETEVLAIVE